ASRAARTAYREAAAALSKARGAAAERLAAAVARELAPLKLDRARFVVARTDLPEAQWNARGADAVRFLVATNPGSAPGPLDKVASGGELSRLLLALNVVLAGESPVGALIFDEVDSGIGGATAAAVGERLARIARETQVLVVTHSPQVAARADAHFQVSKASARDRTRTTVTRLDPTARQEEIARMLAGETITDAARDAARSLMAGS
ncbi:DNA repair protein RecN, partial [Acidiphilium sp. PM]